MLQCSLPFFAVDVQVIPFTWPKGRNPERVLKSSWDFANDEDVFRCGALPKYPPPSSHVLRSEPCEIVSGFMTSYSPEPTWLRNTQTGIGPSTFFTISGIGGKSRRTQTPGFLNIPRRLPWCLPRSRLLDLLKSELLAACVVGYSPC